MKMREDIGLFVFNIFEKTFGLLDLDFPTPGDEPINNENNSADD